jgi:hypothetical protein
VPAEFEAFYRQHLRWRCGRRISASELFRRYHDWAIEAEARSLNYRELRRAMENIGHRHAGSNGCRYFDVEFAELLPDVPDNFPAATFEGGH